MAKFTPGPFAGAISGSVGNVVFTRGRYGSVMRVRAIPVFGESEYRDTAIARLIYVSSCWAGLDDSDRVAWETWAGQHPRVDRLGRFEFLHGQAAYVSCNMFLAESGGSEARVPSLLPDPAPLEGFTIEAFSGPGSVVLSWTSGATSDSEVVHAWAAVLTSAGKSYYKNLLKLVAISDAECASGWDVGAAVETRFDVLEVGWVVKVHAFVVSRLSGYRSTVAVASAVVISA